MNEIQTNNFDYSVLDSSTAEYLQDRENSMSKTLENAAEKLGEDLYKAQQELAKKGYGQFEEWYTSLGLKKRSVYNYIDRYSFVQNLHKQEEIETFQELTPSLQNEMSKPSANPEINQKVFDGDIKTRKEYKELEKKYKEQQERLEKAESMTESTKNWFHDVSNKLKKRDEENEILQSKLEEMENRDPEVIERYSEPDDYREIKKQLEKSETEREELRSQLQKWHLTDKERQEKSDKYDQLNEAINSLDMKLSENQQRMKNRKFINDLIIQSRILMREVAPLTYTIESLHDDDLEQLHNPLNEVANELYKISKDIKNKINSGVIVNE